MSRAAASVMAVLAICSAFAAVGMLRDYGAQGRTLLEVFCDHALFQTGFAIVIPFLVALSEALPVRRPHRVRNVLLLALAGFVLSAVPPLLHVAVTARTAFPAMLRQPLGIAAEAYDHAFLAFLVLVGTQYVNLSAEAAARLQAEAALSREVAQAELRRLRSDLHPHFLFNALNGVSALLREDAAEARRVLRILKELLQRSYAWSGREIRLDEEIGFTARYLDIQKMRFGDRLSVHVELPGSLAGCLVPPLILQPLVENAVLHGIARFAVPGSVTVRAAARDGRLQLIVRDTGPGPVEQTRTRPAMGIAHVRSRLQLLYGAEQQLSLCRRDGGFEAAVTIPLSHQPEPGP